MKEGLIFNEINSENLTEEQKDFLSSDNYNLSINIPSPKNKFEKDRFEYIKLDPYYDTNFFSRLVYIPGFYIIRYIREGLSSIPTIGSLKRDNKSKNYSKRLINQWNHTVKKNLLKIILRANMCPLILILLGGFIQESLTMVSVQLAKDLIETYKPKQKNEDQSEKTKQEILSGYIFLAIHLFYIFFCRQLNDYQISTGYKMGYQLNCLIYSKLMHSKSFKKFISRNKQIITTADIVNYIEIDTYKLINSVLTIPQFVILPYSLIVYFYMIFDTFQEAYIYGCIIFVVFMLTNFIFLAKFRHHQSQEQKCKDSTMKMTIKTLNDIENIKLNAEEVDYIKKIYQNKNKEMACFSNKRLVNNINSAILWFVPIAMTIVTIFVYQSIDHKDIKVENIYSLLIICIQINGPIRKIPNTLRTIYETWVSIKRIENFLKSSEQNEGTTYYEKNNIDLINKRIMIKIENGFFTWGKQKKHNNNIIDMDNIIIKERDSKIRSNSEDSNKLNSLVEESLIPFEEAAFDNNKSLLNSSSNDGNEDKLLYDFTELEMPLEDPETTSTEIVLKDINLTVKKGELVLIYGKSGSGKSSLLEAILNEMQVFLTQENRYKIVTSLNGTTSYSAQIPFIYNSTIRQNITFDLRDRAKTNYNRYLKVIDICSLREDFNEFNGGDLTEIGENGINLSSGQKRRISIARCLYAKKDIYLLDQPTFNMDDKMGLKILIEGVYKFLKNKTRIVVTNREEFAQLADRIVILKKGKIIFNGNFYELTHEEKLKHEGFHFSHKKINFNDILLNTEFQESDNYSYPKKLKSANLSINNPSHSETLLSTSLEDINSSNALICPDLSRQNTNLNIKELTYKTTNDEKRSKYRYLKGILKAPIPFLEGYKLIIMTSFIILEWQLTISCADIWMVFWNKKQGQGLEQNWRYLVVYTSFGFLGAFCVYFRNRFTTKSTNNFVKNLYFHMSYNLVKAPINTFYSETPTSQIINRLSFDVNNVEDNFFRCYVNIISIGTSLVVRMGIFIYFFWGSIYIFPFLSILLLLLTLFYNKSARELYRIECSVRTPLINFLNETSAGKSTIKAFDVVSDFLDEYYRQLDKLFKSRMWINLAYQWLGLILGIFSFSLDLFFIMESMYGDIQKNYNVQPEVYGLLLNYLFTFRDELKQFQFSFSEMQGVSVSFERTNEYNHIFSENYKGANYNIEKEENDDNDISIFKYGKIQFENYSLKYKLNEKIILNELNLTINSGEKIGIIGRTGSGKSTFIYAITRMVEPFTGKIIIDDIDITTIPLQILRRNIGVLMLNTGISEGTLLSNLDPLEKYSNQEILDALKKLNYWFNNNENENYGLNDHIEEGGANLTLSEKTLIAITKLLLKKNCNIILLDDLSSCLDNETQKLVFDAIYSTFPGSTVLIITNIIKEFMKIDKVMSIQNGKIVEFGKLDELKNDKNSYFNFIQGNKKQQEK